MKKTSITFRVEPEIREQLDHLADKTNRRRSDLLNDAVNAYLDLQRWQIEHIEEGLKQADSGEFVRDAEVKKAFERFKS